MAQMIPETISNPNNTSEGEKTLFAIFRDKLSDNFIVWHNPKVRGLEADFILLSSELGLLVIEVKGYYHSNILKANPNFFTIQRTKDGVSKIEVETAPLEQCRRYFIGLLETIKKFPVLCNQSGTFQGKPVFPIGHAAIMSNITEKHAVEDNLIGTLAPPQVAYRDELLSWKEIEESKLVERLREMFPTYFSSKPLTEDQVTTIKGILYPEFVAKSVLATKDSVAEGVTLPHDCKILKTLEVEQERLARKIGEGHRLFSGVAGSGKTIILMARAKFLINRSPESRVLIVCYNISLAAHLRSLLYSDFLNPQYKKIQVCHFHDWAKRLLGRLPRYDAVKGNYDQYLGEKLEEKIASLKEEEKWDSILIDEAHTFFHGWFRCCVQALKDSENGSLVVVSDGSQSLYERTKFRWKSVGIKARGRSKKLDKNYRNTKEILAAAWSIIEGVQEEAEDKEVESTFPIIKPKVCLRNGGKPTFVKALSCLLEVEALIEQILDLARQGYQLKDIGVIYSSIGKNYKQFFDRLIDGLKKNDIDYYWISESRQSKMEYCGDSPGVRITTALSALGLEFKTVLIPWVQQFDNSFTNNTGSIIRGRRQLYVAMTRAQEKLCLFGSGQQAIIRELEQSFYFV